MMLYLIIGMETTEPAMTSGLKPIIMWMETKLSLLHPSNTKSDTDKQIEVQETTFISSLGGGQIRQLRKASNSQYSCHSHFGAGAYRIRPWRITVTEPH